MKRKTDNFNKFFDKKRNSAIKEAFRQEKKAVKKERKDAIERHFEEKRKAREEKFAADADRDAIRKEVADRKRPGITGKSAPGKTFVPRKGASVPPASVQKPAPGKTFVPGKATPIEKTSGKAAPGKGISSQKAAARKAASNKDKGKPVRIPAPGKDGSQAPHSSGPAAPASGKPAPIQKASAGKPFVPGGKPGAPASGRSEAFQKSDKRAPVSGKFEASQKSAADKRAPVSGKFTPGKPGVPVSGKPGTPVVSGKSAPTAAASSSVDPNTLPLNKYIAHSGICSRRDAADLIREGKVSVNGQPVTEPGTKVLPTDTVKVNGKKITISRNFVYILLNKPKDYITTSEDPQGRKTVLDLIRQATTERVYPVGRLDRNTSGVLLLTNDGDLSQKLSHPKHEIKKIYHVTLDKPLTQTDFTKIAEGVKLEDGVAHVDVLAYADARDKAQIGLEIHSGRNRIVRRIFEHLGYDVRGLDRVMYAGLTKKNVQRGKWRLLTEKEIRILKYLNSSMIKSSAPKKTS